MTLPRIVFALIITLVLALVVAQFSPPDDLGRNIAVLIGWLGLAVLVGKEVVGSFYVPPREAMRNIALWVVILALVALAYAYKSNFGF